MPPSSRRRSRQPSATPVEPLRRHLLAALIATALVGVACGSDDEPNPLDGLSTGGDGASTFVAFFDGPPDLSAATDTADWGDRGQATVDSLQQHGAASQADALSMADGAGIEVTSWWVANALSVEGSVELGTALESLPGVTSVIEVSPGTPVSLEPRPAEPDAETEPWHIVATGADTAWESGSTGEGIVVATIDTGVAHDHPVLADSQRIDRSWWDSTGTCPDTPCDDVGHGTATMGLLAGSGGAQPAIGTAPDATWIAAKACGPAGCPLTDVWSATQFLLAPTDTAGTDPDPAARPHIVSMSFELPAGTEGLDPVVQAFAASGILAFFAAGDAGPGCTTVGSPGDHADAFSVGATDSSGTVDEHSSRGPGIEGALKPDVVAPGVDVVSAGVDGGFVTVSGTSMAAPMVAGLAALVLSADPTLAGDPAVYATIRSTATPVEADECSTTGTPNNSYGAGLIDASGMLGAIEP